MLSIARAVIALAALALAGCSTVRPLPVVQNQQLKMPPGTLDKVAVVPFSHRDTLPKYSGEGGVTPDVAAELVTRFVTDALAARGISVIPASDLSTAFSAQGLRSVDLTPHGVAMLASREFGATSILMGEVSRYRERAGEKYGSTTPASVGFNLTLFAAPAGQRVWSSQFDQTQRPLSEDILAGRRYPGGGTRWLSAAELAQWGAESAVETLPAPF
ncbi:MAG TPA: hypothetical protein VEC18_02950 [Myxococcota bacterium]|nr:hypothetical protein [Myxococcota bacterium]